MTIFVAKYRKFVKNMKKILAAFGASLLLMASCTENIDESNRYTFTEETITSYLEKHDNYSEYLRILGEVNVSKRSESTLRQLLSARGNYTVFAPDNKAIQDYLDTLAAHGVISAPSWDAFTDPVKLDSIQKVIAFNSVIDGGDDVVAYQTSTFPNGNDPFGLPNMNERKLSVRYGTNPDSIYINGSCLVSLTNHDIPAINGYIHGMHSVIAPSNETLGDIFHTMIDRQEEGYLVTAKLLQACGLLDTLTKERDEIYEELYESESEALPHTVSGVPTENYPSTTPPHRKYGYTIFAEPDELWQSVIGKAPKDITIQDVRNYIQQQNLCPGATDDENYTSEDNALNQFITYHILPMYLTKNKLTIHFTEKGWYWATPTTYTIPVWEIYTTMGKRRLLKIYEAGPSGPEGFYLNRFPNLNNGRHGNYKENGCDPDKEGVAITIPADMDKNTFVNGIIYPINRILAYDDDTRDNFLRSRMRFDITSIFPEFMNNDIRPDLIGTQQTKHIYIPTNEQYAYLDDVEIGSESMFNYLSGRGSNWANYQGDELNVIGKYELTFRLPPVPRRTTYEIRYLVGAGSSVRSMCQVYFGTNKENLPAQGIPLDLRMGGLYRHTAAGDLPSIVGWEEDVVGDDDYNAEVDKKMRANGFMKGPAYYNLLTNRAWTARDCEYTTRRIIVTATMDPDQVYYLRFKNVLDDEKKQFYMDFIEICPKEVYDNPMTPEDIW